MRTWGRLPNPAYSSAIGSFSMGESAIGAPNPYIWVEVSTDANGDNELVYATALVQTLKLNLNESPFYANWGIPAHPSVETQTAPDYYVALTQSRYAPRFRSLVITKIADLPPTYNPQVGLSDGTMLAGPIPV